MKRIASLLFAALALTSLAATAVHADLSGPGTPPPPTKGR